MGIHSSKRLVKYKKFDNNQHTKTYKPGDLSNFSILYHSDQENRYVLKV